MDYRGVQDYLSKLTHLGVSLGLVRIKELLKRLGNPHHHLRTIHVGGTNGKGSTTAIIGSILNAAGYKTGVFTSPHLYDYTERFCLGGKKINPARLTELFTLVSPLASRMVAEGYGHPTEFEVITAVALRYFYEEEADPVVLEVGLGGSLDATNAVEPMVSLITNVSIDHTEYLGRTVKEIALNKAGIIKENVPLITACDEKQALAVIFDLCRQKKAPFFWVKSQAAGALNLTPLHQQVPAVAGQVTWESKNFSLSGQNFMVKGIRDTYEALFLPLLGRYQLSNAALAITAIEVLRKFGYKVSKQAIRQGLAAVRWPGRFEIIRQNPTVVVDGSHNHAGAKNLRQALDDYFKGKEIIMILGVLKDKEYPKMVAELAPRAKAVIITRPRNPRALDCRVLAVEATKYVNQVLVKENVPAVLPQVLEMARPEEVICFTGSLYLVAEVLSELQNNL
ncbi:MAG: folylpolyglutamate synthase/dihydrofolate synthase family protein [Peptococcaceae bacterium]